MIYTFYTDTHKQFLDDWFMKSIHEKDKVHIEKFKQECESGSFMSHGWKDTMLKKVNYIRECLSQPDPFYHLDCDVQFFRPFYEDYINTLNDNDLDILAQHDGNRTICCGFMLIRPSEKVKTFFDKVYDATKNDLYANDQLACNALLHDSGLRAGLIGNEVFSIWMTNGMQPWLPEHGISNIPKDIRAHHGNYTAGIENKIKLMELVKNEM